MIKRGILFSLLIAGVIIFTWYTSRQLPELSEHTRLLKLDAEGQAINAWAGPWSCVYDTKTKLVWEVKSYTEDIHDHQCSFTWFDGETGILDGGNCYTSSGQSDSSDIIRATNRESRCGLKSWRLPTNAELRTLLIDTPRPGEPHIAADFFPYTDRAVYWTSEANKELTGFFKGQGYGAIAFDFKDGRTSVLPYSNAAFVRLVTKPQGKLGFQF